MNPPRISLITPNFLEHLGQRRFRGVEHAATRQAGQGFQLVGFGIAKLDGKDADALIGFGQGGVPGFEFRRA